MAVRHGYGKVAGAKDLLFAYDTGDTRNSYKGEPTENLFGTTAIEFKSDNPVYTTAITNGSDSIGNYIIKDTVNAPWYTGLRIYQNGVNPLYAGVSYVVSFECRSPQYDWSWGLDANATGGGWSGNDLGRASNTNLVFDKTGGTVYTQDMVDTWQRVTYRVTMKDATTFTGASAYPHDSFFPNQNNIKVYYRNPQIEIGRTTATRYTPGLRSSTQGLLDLTGNVSLNLTNVSFSNTTQPTWDGTNDYISMTGFTQPTDPNNFSVEAVVKLYAHNPGTNIGSVIVNNYSGLNGWIFYLDGPDSRLGLRHHYNGTSGAYSIESTTGINLNQWYHIMGTDDGTTVRLYVNGVQVQSGASVTATNYSGQPLIGQFGGSNAVTNGDIPVVKIYNRALTAPEVKNNYNNYKGRFNI